jgi:hypothetical protein
MLENLATSTVELECSKCGQKRSADLKASLLQSTSVEKSIVINQLNHSRSARGFIDSHLVWSMSWLIRWWVPPPQRPFQAVQPQDASQRSQGYLDTRRIHPAASGDGGGGGDGSGSDGGGVADRSRKRTIECISGEGGDDVIDEDEEGY